MKLAFALILLAALAVPLLMNSSAGAEARRRRPRELGINIGVLPTGSLNAITDVDGVRVGHLTLKEGDTIRTGVTAILPHGGNLFLEKVPGAVFVGNGFGKFAGYTQIEEMGTIETPIVLTNTLSVGAAMEGIVRYAMAQPGNADLASVNAVVGEINDGYLNDIRGLHIRPNHVLQAIKDARGGPVEEGGVGAGFGARAMGFKSGIGTSSRVLPAKDGGYTLGVLVDANFGGSLTVSGVPVGRLLKKRQAEAEAWAEKGSCMIVLATDAPVDAKSLKRIAARAMLGLGRAGSAAGNRSGDNVVAFSTDSKLRVREGASMNGDAVLDGNSLNPLFEAAIEATEEAVLNSIFMARTVTGREGHRVEALSMDETLRAMNDYRPVKP